MQRENEALEGPDLLTADAWGLGCLQRDDEAVPGKKTTVVSGCVLEPQGPLEGGQVRMALGLTPVSIKTALVLAFTYQSFI